MSTIIEVGKHELPKLAYSYDALEPYIDAKTMELHHSKHHQAYVNGLNEAEIALAEARSAGNFKTIGALERALAFHGSGHANHKLFWNAMAPKDKAKPAPEGTLLAQVNRDFGSLDQFKAQFNAASIAVEGNGWGVLAYHPAFNRLYTLGVMNHQNLSVLGAVPLLLLDVWEHAYYLNYQNRRADYVSNWWNVVNWANAEERFASALKLGG